MLPSEIILHIVSFINNSKDYTELLLICSHIRSIIIGLLSMFKKKVCRKLFVKVVGKERFNAIIVECLVLPNNQIFEVIPKIYKVDYCYCCVDYNTAISYWDLLRGNKVDDELNLRHIIGKHITIFYKGTSWYTGYTRYIVSSPEVKALFSKNIPDTEIVGFTRKDYGVYTFIAKNDKKIVMMWSISEDGSMITQMNKINRRSGKCKWEDRITKDVRKGSVIYHIMG